MTDKNTLIRYTYRDAANYKFHYCAVIAGAITDGQISTIFHCLDDQTFFIPRQVGLPCDYARDCDYDEQLDHPWCELDSVEQTSLQPTVELTVEQLVRSFEKAKWEDG